MLNETTRIGKDQNDPVYSGPQEEAENEKQELWTSFD